MTNPASLLRGLAVLALLCLLPRASALTISHQNEQTISSEGNGLYNATATTGWSFPKFDPSLGRLQSVSFVTSITLVAGASETTPNGLGAITWARQLNGDTDWFIVTNGNAINFQTEGFAANGGAVVIANGATESFAATFSHTFTFFTSSPAIVDDFLMGNLGNLSYNSIVFNGARFGGTHAQLTGNTTLTYTYAVPDGGSAAIMLFPTVLLLLAHRRLVRNLPTE